MAGKCCKGEAGACSDKAACPPKCSPSGCCIADALGVPRCVVMTAGAIALVGVAVAVTMAYTSRKQ
jgi:hypothetical protein